MGVNLLFSGITCAGLVVYNFRSSMCPEDGVPLWTDESSPGTGLTVGRSDASSPGRHLRFLRAENSKNLQKFCKFTALLVG